MRTHRWRALIPYYAMLLAPPGAVFLLAALDVLNIPMQGIIDQRLIIAAQPPHPADFASPRFAKRLTRNDLQIMVDVIEYHLRELLDFAQLTHSTPS